MDRVRLANKHLLKTKGFIKRKKTTLRINLPIFMPHETNTIPVVSVCGTETNLRKFNTLRVGND
jgi:hypothetical protein